MVAKHCYTFNTLTISGQIAVIISLNSFQMLRCFQNCNIILCKILLYVTPVSYTHLFSTSIPPPPLFLSTTSKFMPYIGATHHHYLSQLYVLWPSSLYLPSINSNFPFHIKKIIYHNIAQFLLKNFTIQKYNYAIQNYNKLNF